MGPGSLSAYAAIVATRFKMLLQYRAAALAGFGTQLFWGLIKVMIFTAFYASATSVQPMSFAQVVAYIWLSQGLLALLPWNVDAEIAQQIRSGDVAYELLRPLDLYSHWFARTLAFRAAPTILRVTPMLIFAFWVLPLIGLEEWALQAPSDGLTTFAFLVAVVGMLFLSTAFTMVMHISLMWTLSGEGVNRFMPGIVPVLAGLIVPLPLFPNWLQPFLYWQPFRSMADAPFRIYSGHIPITEAWLEIAMQWAWFGIIVGFGYWLLSRARHNLVVQGG